ncbi:MAG: type II toxin-antitoxin system PemK/MazF family toxin [Proteobacteria bacterium]|nr:type II toxin-antitoxin system PemK/MazF family toxin [Pseudomonadota bacterium]
MRKRGSVWLAHLNPGRGTEPDKIRPVLIVQSQALLEADHPSTLIYSPDQQPDRCCRTSAAAPASTGRPRQGLRSVA